MRKTKRITELLQGFIQEKLYKMALENMCKECFTDLILEDLADRLIPAWVAEFEENLRKERGKYED